MSGCHISNRQGFPAYMRFVCCAFLMMLTVGCGDESANSVPAGNVTADAADTGSVTLSIQWHRASATSDSGNTLTRQAIDDCGAAGAAFITADVYDASNNPIASGGPWSCNDRGGRIERIPAGPNRKIVVLGWDTPRENILYQGHTPSGINITAGEITDAGTIVAYSFIPSGLVVTANSNSRIGLVWNDLDEAMGVGGYRIYRDGEAMATSDLRTYEDSNLRPGIQYCYTVAAYDIFDNESGQSEERCATTEPFVDDVDNDGDGYSELQGDCNDANAEVNPGATEICNDGIDNNCNNETDENCAIDVNIDSDFQFMDEGSPMGLPVGQTVAGALRESPYEELTEPSYYDLYGEFFSTSYGYLRMGNSQDNTVSFVIIQIQGEGEDPDSYRLFIDSNNNENLTDDDGPHLNQGTGRLEVLVSLDAAVVDDSGTTITRPYNLWMWLDDNSAVRFYARCHYTGQIRIGGEMYTAVAFERRNHDALYRESGLYIDLNRNDQLDVERENFMDQTMVGVDGRQYELLLNYP